MKSLIIIAAAAATAYVYVIKKENQIRKYEQLDHGEETRCM
ncbi:hypothetical protein SAMN05421503_2438 [Terribacillus aidingensis]|uniref:Uncharacterized protein n=1 Tax=Terribacillus aidingensis TaxID=586416 RepID=A0A285P2Y3_9BACI|nr:hypothetical protein [Terribacillus aidingensis]SNZ14516.1 hypothetical protein SAMN05421503_2438 [Terribacillus aidingensis]